MKKLASVVFAIAVAAVIGYGCVKVLRSLGASWAKYDAEYTQEQKVAFTAAFNLPAEDFVGSDEFEVRRRIVNNHLHLLAVEIDKEQQLLWDGQRAVFQGTGSDYTQDVEVVRSRRTALAALETKLATDRAKFEKQMSAANFFNYGDIASESEAAVYTPEESSSSLFAWVGAIWATIMLWGASFFL